MSMASVKPKVCDTCRVKKTYCDRGRPSCSKCLENKFVCGYDYVLKKRGIPKGKKLKRYPKGYEEEYVNYTSSNFNQNLVPDGKPIEASKLPHMDQYNENSNLNLQENGVVRTKIQNRYKIQMNLNVSLIHMNYKFGMMKVLFNNSIMDTKQRVFMTSTGRMDYYGESPMGLLLTMYIVHHSKPKSLDLLYHSKKHPPEPAHQPTTRTFNLASLKDPTINLNIFERCIHAYFQYFHPYFPVVNKRKILTCLSSQSPTLINIIASIGSGYLTELSTEIRDYFSDYAILHLNSSYYKPSLENVAALLIMSTFQHSPKYCNRGFMNLGHAIRMSYALGLDSKPPAHLDKQTQQLRKRLWLCCHIIDKLYGFGMNRPFFHDYRLTYTPTLSFCEMDFMDKDTLHERSKMHCGLLYITIKSELCQFMYLMVRKFKFMEKMTEQQMAQYHYLVQATTKHLQLWEHRMLVRFNELSVKKEIPLQICQPFILQLQLTYNSTLLQLYQTFPKSDSYENYHKLATLAANNSIAAAKQLHAHFYFTSITYKFYCLAIAAFYQIRNISSITNEEDLSNKDLELNESSKRNLLTALVIFKNCKPFYALASECLHMALLLAKSENLDLSQEFYKFK